MSERSRRTRFEERVRIEREFLVPVNRRVGALAPLGGMTGDAIETWRRSALAAGAQIDVVSIADLLRRAARRAELLADNSRDVFVKGRSLRVDGLDALRRQLDDLLS